MMANTSFPDTKSILYSYFNLWYAKEQTTSSEMPISILVCEVAIFDLIKIRTSYALINNAVI